MTQKIPPPPPVAASDPVLNRWLLELQSILTNSGGIDPNNIAGYTALQAQVATNTTNITTLQGQVASGAADIATLQGQVATLQTQMAAANSAITALGARAQVLNGTAFPPGAGLGNDGDWYASTGGTKHIYVKVTGAWVQIV